MKDLITEARELCKYSEKIVNQLHTERLDYELEYMPLIETIQVTSELCDALEKAQEDAVTWIPVTERLPEASGAYWVNLHQEDEDGNDADFCIEAWYQVNSLLFAPKEVGWQLLNEWYEFSGQMRQYISHWMELPAPPKGD